MSTCRLQAISLVAGGPGLAAGLGSAQGIAHFAVDLDELPAGVLTGVTDLDEWYFFFAPF